VDHYPIFDDEPNTAFKSFILQFATFGIAYYFRVIKTGKALGRRVIFYFRSEINGTTHF
jgi:hypothetical protein